MGEEIIVKATREQINDFKESFLWEDIKTELLSWQQGFEGEMMSVVDEVSNSNLTTASVLTHIGDINGRVKTVNYLLSLPDIFLQILDDKKDDSKLVDEE